MAAPPLAAWPAQATPALWVFEVDPAPFVVCHLQPRPVRSAPIGPDAPARQSRLAHDRRHPLRRCRPQAITLYHPGVLAAHIDGTVPAVAGRMQQEAVGASPRSRRDD